MPDVDDILAKWDRLTSSEQDRYVRRADYLIEHGYVMDIEPEDLAKKIYIGEQQDDSTDN